MAAKRKVEAAPAGAPPSPGDTRDRLAAMASVAAKFSAFKPAAQVLTRVRAVPTDFIQLDYATRCGGWPIERFCTLHGPSNEGKTLTSHGLGLSFLSRGHYYAFVDAEFTTPADWLRRMMGAVADHPGFVALRPDSFESTVDEVRKFCLAIKAAREKGDLQTDTSALIVVDSVRKLVPRELIKRVEKDGTKHGVDGYSGRAAQFRAALMSQWLDELVPLLYHSGTSMIAIAREADDPDASAMERKFGSDWKVQGAKALVYDASLVARITRGWLREKDETGEAGEEGERSDVIGERHRVRLWKTKVGTKEGAATDAFIHTSNGATAPEGFDFAMDSLRLAEKLEVVEKAGAWISWGRHKWQGRRKALQALREKPALRLELNEALRERFTAEPDKVEP